MELFRRFSFLAVVCSLLIFSLAAAGTTGTKDPDLRMTRIIHPSATLQKISHIAPPLPSSGPAVVYVNAAYNSGSAGGHTWGVDAFASIQAGIDAVAAGGVVNVAPGSYFETASGRTPVSVPGTYTFGLFIGQDKAGITVRGVDAGGTPITDAYAVLANVQTESTNDFGPDGAFIEGDNVTVTGLKIWQDPALGLNKTVSVIGNNFTLRYSHIVDISPVEPWGSVYIDDELYNASTNISHIQQYTIRDNWLENCSIDPNNGAGYTGPASGRLIQNNTIDLGPWAGASISFSGTGTGVPWFVHGVGGAVITGNSFLHNAQHIRARGDYDNSQFDWAAYWNTNTFDNSSLVGTAPPANVREYSYTGGYGPINHCRRIAGVVQGEIDHSQAADIVLVGPGTYVEQLEITHALTLHGVSAAASALRAPVTLTKYFTSPSNNYPIVYIHGTDGVTVSGLTIDGYGRGNGNYRFVGVGFNNAGGTVQNCTVKDIRETPFNGDQHGVGVYSYNSDAVARSIALTGNTFTTFQKNAISLVASDATPLAVSITGNTVTGYGTTTITAQNGIQVWALLGTGTISGNTISGIGYDNTSDPVGYVATSILNFEANLVITGNQVTSGQVGIYNYDAPGQVTDNTLTLSKVGITGYGIILTDPPKAVPSPLDHYVPAKGTATARNTASGSTLTLVCSGNDITFSGINNAGTEGLEADAGFGADNLALTVNHNTVSGFETGMVFYTCQSGCAAGLFTSIDARYNSVAGNTAAIYTNVVSPLVDLSGSWWGSTNEAAILGTVTGTVDYTPWLASGADLQPGTSGFQGDVSALFVSAASPQTSGPRIQEAAALTGAAGTVTVLSGTYPENLALGYGLTINGAASPARPLLAGHITTTASGLTLTGLTLRNLVVSNSDWLLDFPVPTTLNSMLCDNVDFRYTGATLPSTAPSGYNNIINFPSITVGGTSGLSFHNSLFDCGNPSGGDVSEIWMQVTGGPITFDGCTIQGHFADNVGAQVNMGTAGTNVTLANTSTLNGGNFYLSTITGLSVHNCTFDGSGLALNGVVKAVVNDNIFRNMGTGIIAGGTENRSVVLKAAWGALVNDSVVIRNNTFTNLTIPAIVLNQYTTTPPTPATFHNVAIHNNDFSGVTGTAVQNTYTGVVMDATDNYWGSLYGPSDPAGTIEVPKNPKPAVTDMKNTVPSNAIGCGVSDNVDYYPWTGPVSPGGGGGIWVGGYVNPTANGIFAGFDPAALDGVDPLDVVAPPPPPSDYLYLYFLLAPGQPISNYSADIKKADASLDVHTKGWDLRAITDHTNMPVTLEFPFGGLSGYTPVLYDLANDHYQDLNEDPYYVYTSPATESVYSFRLLMGDNTPPAVSVTAPNGGEYLVVGQPYTIHWTSSDATGLLRHYILYSASGVAPYTLIDSVNGGVSSYAWTPSAATLTGSIKVVARDSVLNENAAISTHTFTILSSSALTFSAAAGWNLVSPPMLQADMTPAGVFGDDYGASPYYVFRFNPSSGYAVPATLQLGEGYWLGSNSAQVIDAVGTPVSGASLLLNNGYDIIGNPFATALSISDLRFTDGVAAPKTITEAATAGWLLNVLWAYNGLGYVQEHATLGIWKGYWIPVLRSGVSILYSPTVGTPTPKAAPDAETITADHWALGLSASFASTDGATVTDDIATFGVRGNATAGFDRLYDAPRPPRVPGDRYVEVSFPAATDGLTEVLAGMPMAMDFRAAAAARWDVSVTTSGQGSATLTWDKAKAQSLGTDVALILHDGSRSINMKNAGSYTWNQIGTTHQFSITTGTEPALPATVVLAPNTPNPFNPTTTLQFGLPYDANVTLDVYNSLGQRVASVLQDAVITAGFHSVVFDGAGLASGVYVCRIHARPVDGNGADIIQSRKMMLVR